MTASVAAAKAAEEAEEAAVLWLVELRSGPVDAVMRGRFERWLEADDHHRLAWLKLGQAVDATFGGVHARAGLVGRTLDQAASRGTRRRRLLGGALLLAGAAVGAGWAMRGSPFMDDWSADLHTGTGRRRRFTLADGSVLTLNARSSVDIDFDDRRRLVRLRQGDLVADVADVQRLPFIVESMHGAVEARGPRFMVGLGGGFTRALAMRADLAVMPRAAAASSLLHEGEAGLFDQQRLLRLPQSMPEQAAAWLDGQLLAFDQPLGEIADALRPYLDGLLHVSPAAAALRATGNYALDRPQQTLRTLAETLPIRVARSAGGLLTRITTDTV